MRRIVILPLALLMAPLVTDAQRAGKGVRIGVLSTALPRSATQWVAFEQRLLAALATYEMTLSGR
jgi:hypothetical protein